MWIVKFDDNSKHSAWDTKREALQQVKILEQNGYIRLHRRDGNNGTLNDFVEYDATVSCENGHYYI